MGAGRSLGRGPSVRPPPSRGGQGVAFGTLLGGELVGLAPWSGRALEAVFDEVVPTPGGPVEVGDGGADGLRGDQAWFSCVVGAGAATVDGVEASEVPLVAATIGVSGTLLGTLLGTVGGFLLSRRAADKEWQRQRGARQEAHLLDLVEQLILTILGRGFELQRGVEDPAHAIGRNPRSRGAGRSLGLNAGHESCPGRIASDGAAPDWAHGAGQDNHRRGAPRVSLNVAATARDLRRPGVRRASPRRGRAPG